VEGKNIVIEFRWTDGGRLDRLPDLAADLVRLKVDVLVTAGTAGSAPTSGHPIDHGSLEDEWLESSASTNMI